MPSGGEFPISIDTAFLRSTPAPKFMMIVCVQRRLAMTYVWPWRKAGSRALPKGWLGQSPVGVADGLQSELEVVGVILVPLDDAGAALGAVGAHDARGSGGDPQGQGMAGGDEGVAGYGARLERCGDVPRAMVFGG
jgi:hypothetical protein